MSTPTHLRLLLDKTPLGIERIKIAWPWLSISDRAYLLTILLADSSKVPKALEWQYHRNKLVDLALADDSPYIRYLAARDVSEPVNWHNNENDSTYLENMSRFERVKSDSIMLIHSANKEDAFKFSVRELEDPKSFWERPQVERLALVQGVEGDGERIAELLRYATKNLLPDNIVSNQDALDVLLQYVSGKTISERVADAEAHSSHFYDGFAEWNMWRSVKALWNSIPDISKDMAFVLLKVLPDREGSNSIISEHVIESLDNHQLETLLYRNDLELQELRRNIYKESDSDMLRLAAVSSQKFKLLDSDISELVYNPHEEPESGIKKVNEAVLLAKTCAGANLVQMEAICCLIEDAPKSFHSPHGQWEYISFGQRLQTERAKRLSQYALKFEVLNLRLFEWAKELAPIGDQQPTSLQGNLAEHRDKVVPHNPWQTYLNFSKIIPKDRIKEIIYHLPSVYIRDFSIPEDVIDGFDVNSDHRIFFDLVRHVQERVENLSEQDRVKLSAFSNAFEKLSNQVINMKSINEQLTKDLQSRIHHVTFNSKLLLFISTLLTVVAIFK